MVVAKPEVEAVASTVKQTKQPDLNVALKRVFGRKVIEVKDYDGHLKSVSVDSDHLFVSHDGRYIFAGPVYDTLRNVDIVAEGEAVSRKARLDKHPNDLFVRYPSNKEKYVVTIFTAINCPYCRKLHNSIGALNKSGVSVNYVMLPRGGVGSAPYAKTLSALCSDNPATSITQAMQSLELPSKACDPKSLIAHINLARELNVNSTPTFVLPNGQRHVGYIKPETLLALLEASENEKN